MRGTGAGERVVVVGGGVIGLSCARELATAGCAVTVLDAAPEAREASWAAAGMLAPHHENDADGPLWRLGVASLALWPGFAAAACADAGAAPAELDHRCAGGLVPLMRGEPRAALAARAAFLAAAGIAVAWHEGAALARLEPALAANPQVEAVLHIAGAQVNPRALTTVLRAGCARLGVDLRYGATIAAIDGDGVGLDDGTRLAGRTVLASGAWTPSLARLAGLDLAGEPVKGQMLRLAAADGLLGRFVHHHQAYLVPRRGLGVVVGATMVLSGFDRSQDGEAIARLAEGARRLLPTLAGEPLETWTGLRPRLRGGLPVIARARDGLYIATGHFRNGILLAPITAQAIASLVLDRPPACDLAPFALA